MGDYFVCSKTDPVVETKAGKVRGFRLNTTYAFHGIHYAEADRFQMPQPVKPWKGIKNALAYGYVCPLLKQDEPNMEVLVPHRYWPQDEHCQNLNVWTQSLDPGAKKPGMVWLHGGGFSAATDIALANLGLSRRVVLSVPHFLFMLETLRNSDLVAVVPERLARGVSGLMVVEPPLAVAGFDMLMLWHERWHRDPAHQWLRQQIVMSLEDKSC